MQMPLTATCICLSILTSRVRHFWYISHEGISTNGQYNIQFINATFSMHQRLDCVSPSTSLTRSFASRVWALALLSSSVSAKQQLRKRDSACFQPVKARTRLVRACSSFHQLNPMRTTQTSSYESSAPRSVAPSAISAGPSERIARGQDGANLDEMRNILSTDSRI